MKKAGILAGCLFVLALCWDDPLFGQAPVKWSVPLQEYPRPWVPTTAPPPQFVGPGYPYPHGYYPYGYGAYYPGHYPGGAPGYAPWYQQGAYFGYPPQPQQ